MDEPENTSPPASAASSDDTEFLIRYLATHDVYCPLCQYNFRNLTRPRCPECGRGIKLTVALAEPALFHFIALVAGLCLAAGAGVPAGIFVIYDFVHRSGELWNDTFPVRFVFGGSALSIIPALFALVSRRRFLRLPRKAQAVLAASAWLWDLTLLYAFLFGVVWG